jgi:hypothetical protein
MILPTMAPIAVLSSLDEPGADVGPAEVELEVTEDSVDEPVDNVPVDNVPVEGVSDNEEVPDGESNVVVDVGGKVEEGGVAGVEEGVGVALVELDGVGDSVVLGGGVGPP